MEQSYNNVYLRYNTFTGIKTAHYGNEDKIQKLILRISGKRYS